MAGVCTGAGLTIDGDGHVALNGASSLAWPALCPIGTANGLHTDPVTGKAWVLPHGPAQFADLDGGSTVIAPANDSDKAVGHKELEYTVTGCRKQLMVADVMGGYAGFRCGSGNFWILERYASFFLNTVATLFTGSQPVAAHENNSGGVDGHAGPIEATRFIYTVSPGDVVKIVTDYTLTCPGFAANVLNSFTIRRPRISILFLPTE